MMFCAPWAVASCPESGIGLSFFALSAVTTAFARPSLAAATASILLPVGDEHLLEDRACLLVVPLRHTLIRALRRLAALDERIEDARIALLEQLRVVVRRAAVQVRDDRLVAATQQALGRHRGLDALAHEPADRRVVERHVVVRALAAGVEPVVVDRLDLPRRRGLDDRAARARIEARQQDHLGTVREALVGLRALPLGVTLRVHDGRRDVRLLEGGDERRTVLRLPPDRRLRVRQQHARLDGRGLFLALRECSADRQADDEHRHRERDDELLHSVALLFLCRCLCLPRGRYSVRRACSNAPSERRASDDRSPPPSRAGALRGADERLASLGARVGRRHGPRRVEHAAERQRRGAAHGGAVAERRGEHLRTTPSAPRASAPRASAGRRRRATARAARSNPRARPPGRRGR